MSNESPDGGVIEREDRRYRPVAERVKTWDDVVAPLPEAKVRRQASRCLDCGVPFCHTGCPVSNLIPDWNKLVRDDDWRQALDHLHATNNFPEFTGRVCPAPCEAACTLNIEDVPVTIKTIECAIIDRGWQEGWVTPEVAPRGTGKRIAVVGSGPAGLACAQQLARMGHAPTVFEKNDRIGGLLRYGIPDFKLEKHQIDRRIAQMEAEGVIFRTGMNIGVSVPFDRIMDDYDVMVLAGGAEQPRDLTVPGREHRGIHFAMDYLSQSNRRVAQYDEHPAPILATGKRVVVIGGGDTGSDCIGTANRQGAASIVQLEIMPEPPARENKDLSWPRWPLKLRTSSSHEEGSDRAFEIITTGFEGTDGPDGSTVSALLVERGGVPERIEAELVLLAMGFTGSPAGSVLDLSGARARPTYDSDRDGVFMCGDMRRGQSLVVWAIREGRDCATAVDRYLKAQA